MTKCPKCNYERKPNSIECPHCGIVYEKYEKYVDKKRVVQESTNQQEVKKIDKEKDNNFRFKKYFWDSKQRRLFIILIPVIVIIAIVGHVKFPEINAEIKARRVVDAHLKSIMTGKGNPYSTVDPTKIEKIFINVLDFKYLNTLKKDRVQNDPMVFNQKYYEEYYKNIYDSYEKFLQEMKRIYSDRAIETEVGLIVKSEDYHYEFEFLYDVTLTNKLGMKLYKKYVFEVKPSLISDSGYVITGFYER
jgi:6-pyruvoyl-tetrahydropterin synthase